MSFEYQAYMLRLWSQEENGENHWRASLEAPGSGERQNFDSVAELIAYLQSITGETGAMVTHSIKERDDEETKIEISIRIKQSKKGEEDAD